ncbi:zinc-binding alcohol dehydrogenase family protein [Massilia sp. CF038]|uniref:zinc-binding alcohol dehydrogenase family protein n=1 Tax=Massilia sp. CF038 TaxID=1881045 RepID=UPI000920D614|nr:zinc-binding alcohol dehydrogenase family protein [Massilia sp. CF038]SHH66366.1 zinc-binding alcohol dehydrogenase family protein [Massilia sp. CF038]
MKAIAVQNGTLQDLTLPLPQPGARDLVVKIEAISVNPVDHKVRAGEAADAPARVLGWDAAGTVTAVGPEVTLFRPGDQVYYAGSIVRPGANSEYHLVDERIAARKPATLDFAQAAALPLTSITAWEALFNRLGISRGGADQGKRILIVGGAGGVGSIAIQLAKKLARLTVVATASRPESGAWCKRLGADHVIDHNGDIPAQLAALGMPGVDYILCLNEIDKHFPALVEAIAPQGRICSILGNQAPLALDGLFTKSAGLVFELMFTRSMFETSDMLEQHILLTEVAGLVDEKVLVTTVGESFGKINAANIERAHAALLGRRMIGKIVLAGF